MSITARLAKAEAGLGDALRWREAERLAREFDKSAQSFYDEIRTLEEKYRGYEVVLPNGMVDFEPMIRAAAEREGVDYEELMTACRQIVRRTTRRLRK